MYKYQYYLFPTNCFNIRKYQRLYIYSVWKSVLPIFIYVQYREISATYWCTVTQGMTSLCTVDLWCHAVYLKEQSDVIMYCWPMMSCRVYWQAKWRLLTRANTCCALRHFSFLPRARERENGRNVVTIQYCTLYSIHSMMEDSDILTLGWGCEAPPPGSLWGHHGGGGGVGGAEEFVTLEESHMYCTHTYTCPIPSLAAKHYLPTYLPTYLRTYLPNKIFILIKKIKI